MIHGEVPDILSEDPGRSLKGSAQLLLTSPPFPLNRKKKYGNKEGEEYVEWLADLAEPFADMLTADGSLVIEMGNAWEAGRPTQSTLALEALLAFKRRGDFHLCQEFIWFNPARLPSPIEWVNKRRIRVKDSFTRLWWLARTPEPKADNRNVLQEYSGAMKKLLKRGSYHSGKRPSEHDIGKTSFLVDNGGSIPPNVLTYPNTANRDDYHGYCKENGMALHPARMPEALAEFFVLFLTDPGDLVVDPFAGSNTTGAMAERHGRRWVSFEANVEYIEGSRGRFADTNRANRSGEAAD